MKEKITTGANDRPKNETIAQTGEGLPDESRAIIDVASDGEAKIREDLEKDPDQTKPTGPAVSDEDPDYSPMDEDDRKYGNIETGLPGSEQSLNDINRGVEEVIKQRENDQKDD